MTERRREPTPSTPDGFLNNFSARALLERMPTPTLAVGLDGKLVYANPACAAMLGHTDTSALIEVPLPALLDGHADTPPPDCVAALKAAGSAVIAWCHSHGFPVHTVVSEPLLLRADEPVLLISMTDVTEWLWDTRPRAGHDGHDDVADNDPPHRS